MIYALPIIGHLLGFILFTSVSLPFWMFWTVFGMGEKYFYFVPPAYYHIGFWETFMVFSIISILKAALIPRFTKDRVLTQEQLQKIVKEFKENK